MAGGARQVRTVLLVGLGIGDLFVTRLTRHVSGSLFEHGVVSHAVSMHLGQAMAIDALHSGPAVNIRELLEDLRTLPTEAAQAHRRGNVVVARNGGVAVGASRRRVTA